MYEEIEVIGMQVARILDIRGRHLTVTRKFANGRITTFQGFPGMRLFINDHLNTGKTTQGVIEFDIGGIAGINRDTEVVVNGQREIVVVGNRLLLKAGTFWAKFNGRDAPLQIQTAGGVMGIEG